ncbi:hypothetical protein P153DRAFT_380950 [Dothidotthia symphoricarpi CBS 119687]|uniref:Uncharacterized protein n=1 Tax=Dothidotthia symphoricarpi CBS 119687 TaxID=1392245 RepID=A0A6A6APC1_9PLEO|nr:uncharacterized protein P153DRAFT_380950 [Dothidotthia symphoricarpi CBS 119687]KAF2133769.1 hypothetical protein P153DRAFT_380950 [Dothidotthia symphoricarpi CBS 119687]
MALSHQELLRLHQKATMLLEHKLKKIPARVWASGRHPTISDIYERPNELVIEEINPQTQLAFIFENFDKFAAAGFRARRHEQDMLVTVAIFYWQMDPTHSFSHRHKEVRWNVLLALIKLNAPDSDTLGDELTHYLNSFIDAWMDACFRVEWGTAEDRAHETRDYFIARCFRGGSKLDLVTWTSSPRKAMATAVKKLEALVPPMPFEPKEFWTKAREQPVDEWKRNGRAWAMQYVIHTEGLYAHFDQQERHLEAQILLEGGDLTKSFGNMGVEGAPPQYLCEALFEQPLVKALLVDVDEDVRAAPAATYPPWMSPAQAIELIEGVAQGVDDITEGLKGMSYLEDKMEM